MIGDGNLVMLMSNKAKLKQFFKEYIFAPKLLRLLQYFMVELKAIIHINKQHHQYPHSWNGENFNHAHGGKFLKIVSKVTNTSYSEP